MSNTDRYWLASSIKIVTIKTLLPSSVASCLLRLVRDGRLRQRRLHREDAVLRQRRLDGLWIGTLGEQELAVVLTVDGLALALFLVLGVN
jgi:hypothetical protein